MADNSDIFYKEVGLRIRDIRISKGMSQSELAEKAHLSLPVISKIEHGSTKMWLMTFKKIAEALDTSSDELLKLDVTVPTAGYPERLTELFEGCTTQEIESIIAVVGQMKSTFRMHKKEYDD